jgi:uncharacterized membrane protein
MERIGQFRFASTAKPCNVARVNLRRAVMPARSIGSEGLVFVVGLAHHWWLLVVILILILIIVLAVDVIGIAQGHAECGKCERLDPEEADVVGCDGQGL